MCVCVVWKGGGLSVPVRVPVSVVLAGCCGPSLFPCSTPEARVRRGGRPRCVRQGAAVSRSEAAPLPLHHREENTTRWRFRIAALLSRRGSARTANFQY